MEIFIQFAQNVIHVPHYDHDDCCIFCKTSKEEHTSLMQKVYDKLNNQCEHNNRYPAHGKEYCCHCGDVVD